MIWYSPVSSRMLTTAVIGAHADQAVRSGGPGQVWPGGVQQASIRGPQHGAHEQGWREDAPRASDGDGQGRRNDLADQEHDQQPRSILLSNAALQHGIADTIHLGQDQQYEPQPQPSHRWPQPLWPAPDPIGEVLVAIENTDECDSDHRRAESEPRIEGVLGQRRARTGATTGTGLDRTRRGR
jgi:hypothetical protein